jgi:hypothetical protein
MTYSSILWAIDMVEVGSRWCGGIVRWQTVVWERLHVQLAWEKVGLFIFPSHSSQALAMEPPKVFLSFYVFLSLSSFMHLLNTSHVHAKHLNIWTIGQIDRLSLLVCRLVQLALTYALNVTLSSREFDSIGPFLRKAWSWWYVDTVQHCK